MKENGRVVETIHGGSFSPHNNWDSTALVSTSRKQHFEINYIVIEVVEWDDVCLNAWKRCELQKPTLNTYNTRLMTAKYV